MATDWSAVQLAILDGDLSDVTLAIIGMTFALQVEQYKGMLLTQHTLHQTLHGGKNCRKLGAAANKSYTSKYVPTLQFVVH